MYDMMTWQIFQHKSAVRLSHVVKYRVVECRKERLRAVSSLLDYMGGFKHMLVHARAGVLCTDGSFMLYAVSDNLVSHRFSPGVYLGFYGNKYFL
jgi:hypothetical protein